MTAKTKKIPEKIAKQNGHLPYGQGQREQYGEGYAYRHEELSRAADASAEHDWAGGDHSEDEQSIPETAPINKKTKND